MKEYLKHIQENLNVCCIQNTVFLLSYHKHLGNISIYKIFTEISKLWDQSQVHNLGTTLFAYWEMKFSRIFINNITKKVSRIVSFICLMYYKRRHRDCVIVNNTSIWIPDYVNNRQTTLLWGNVIFFNRNNSMYKVKQYYIHVMRHFCQQF